MQIVNYSNQKPPVYDRCVRLFGADWEKGTIFTYGTTIHCKYDIPDHLKAHEGVHVRQQLAFKGGAEAWWEKYFEDQLFRMSQEIEAYKEQIEYAKKTMNRDNRRKLKEHILNDMCHNHGKMCSRKQAEAHLYGRD